MIDGPVQSRRSVRRGRAILLVVAMGGVGLVGVEGATAQVTQVGGGAFGEQVRGVLSSGPIPSVTLPAAGGGPFKASTASVSVGTVLRTGVMSVSTKGVGVGTPEGFVQSSASLSGVVIAGGIVTADQLTGQCRSDRNGSRGSVSAVNLRVQGVRIRSDVTTSITIPDGKVALNEQTVTGRAGSTAIVVNALRVTILDSSKLVKQEIIVGQARCEAKGPSVNQPPPPPSSSSTSTSTTSTTMVPTKCSAQCTIFSSSSIPTNIDGGEEAADVELGVRFFADTDGEVTGIRFYKAPNNTGVHVGTLWHENNTPLASETFSSETASGWQQVNFAAPVPVSAGTVYVASYHTTAGHYSFDGGYFAFEGVDSGPLHAPVDEPNGARNGGFKYGPSGFPNEGFGGANYWVDVVFNPTP